jgi:hypothetical protein
MSARRNRMCAIRERVLAREIGNYDNGRDRGEEIERRAGRRDTGEDNRGVC